MPIERVCHPIRGLTCGGRGEEPGHNAQMGFPAWPDVTSLKMIFSDWSMVRSALDVGSQHLSRAATDSGAPIVSKPAHNLGLQVGEQAWQFS